MAAVMLALYASMFLFALSGILLVGAVGHYRRASRICAETKLIALRAMALRRR